LLTTNSEALTDKKNESLFTAIYIGALFIILALVYYIHLSDDLWGGLVNFFSSLTLAPVPSTGISLPAPSNPTAHLNLYVAAFQFTLAVGVVEIVILLLRVKLGSPVTRKAETIENIVFWLGTSYLITTYLVNMNIPSAWFVFWAGVILIFGLALIARAFVLLAKR
jgi:tellurite resistance protein TehA-like permease